jgi:mono/diheme cytochrome c family protein
LRTRLLWLALPVVLAACGAPAPPVGEQPLDTAFRNEGLTRTETLGQRVFVSRCATCHGEKGRGDGQNAYNLDPPPPDFAQTLPALPEPERRLVVMEGTAALGRSAMCPPWGRSLEARETDAVLAYLEALARPMK